MLKQLMIVFVFATMTAFPYVRDSGMVKIISASNAAEFGQAPQINDERGIKVTVTRQNTLNEATTLAFEVILETHTRDLSDDLTKSSVLVADGKQYMPLGWKGAPPGGHHRKGLLRFKAIVPQPKTMELQIRLAGDPSPRSFKWLLK
ncbi:hypothetical protein GALLN_00338 [Gallionellaceae bacterium]|nr:hypothetical protein GALLN_00338 [Gallionellaceae bacterium]